MEAPFQIVGCVLSSTPAAQRIDSFVAQVRRDRGVVIHKDALSATFVRFNAPDAGLVTLACQAVLAQAPSSLRFGLASGAKEASQDGNDRLDISNRSIAQASELASGARDGEVLVSPSLALLLIEAGFSLHSKQLQLGDGRQVAACSLDLIPSPVASSGSAHRPGMEGKLTDALGSVYRTLMAQADEVARKQSELDTRLDAALGRVASTGEAQSPAPFLNEIEAELDAQLIRVERRLQFIDGLEARVKQLDQTASELSRQAVVWQAQRDQMAGVAVKFETLTTLLTAAQTQLDDMLLAQERMAPLLGQVASLTQQLDRSKQAMADQAHRLEALDRNAEAVEHKIQSLAEREALVQAVKLEVDNIRQISLESKADLQHVSGQRAEVSEMRGKLDELLGRVKDTDSQIALIESRRKTVEEVQSRAAAITHMLGDINVNLEMLSEQRAVIDHVGEKLARLDFTVQEAQNTLRSLQREREVAERIEQGIKALRARSSGGLDKLA
jgi:archaellum component FlaC